MGRKPSLKVCKVEGCGRRFYSKNYCSRHYWQIRRDGKISGSPYKSHHNEFVISGDICRMSLYDKHGFKRQEEVIIDSEDHGIVFGKKWCFNDNGYVSSSSDGEFIRLHRLIMGVNGTSQRIDHIDRDPLNNRKENLRFCTQQQNCCNRKVNKGNRSGYKGVEMVNENSWRVSISAKNKKYYLGTYNDKHDAAMAYNVAAKKLHGEFAWLNEI